ncbi:MAG: sigma-70 family RNA polymerase sigma factor [Bacteroidota bacterium]
MDFGSMNDQELVSQYVNGNEECFEILVRRHKTRLFSYIYHQVRDRELANDIFQDTFVKVINTLKQGCYNEEGKFLPWVMRISHNLIIDHFRKAAKIPTIDNSKTEYDIFSVLNIFDENVEEQIITNQIHHDVRRLVEMLPDEQKEVLKLRHYSDMSFKDIADNTNVSINTALGRMRYAILNLRKLIEDNNIILSV